MGKKQEGEPSLFLARVILSRTDYFNYHFSDDRKWISYHLGSPDARHTLYGYVRRGSGLHLQLERLLGPRGTGKGRQSRTMTFRLAFPKGDRRKQVEIRQIVTTGWVVSSKQQERAAAKPEQ